MNSSPGTFVPSFLIWLKGGAQSMRTPSLMHQIRLPSTTLTCGTWSFQRAGARDVHRSAGSV
jgi:hypothetical protein